MKRLALFAGLLTQLANAGVFTTEHIQAYPSDWPNLSSMSGTCAAVQGAYVDPNSWRWAREDQPGSPFGGKYGGTREAAWIAFGFSPQDLSPESQKIKSRRFTLAIDSDQSLRVRYLVDEKVVASRSFSKDKLSCGQDGLTITIMDRSGIVLDKLPNEGHMLNRSTLYKQDGHLYIKTTDETKARVAHVFPQSFLSITWLRFQEVTHD
jgi:hypothetical protein